MHACGLACGFASAAECAANCGNEFIAVAFLLSHSERSIKAMPDRVSADDVIDRIILLRKIEEAVADSEAGRTISLSEAKKRHAKWLK